VRKHLYVFMTCQRSGSSATAGYFHRLGMSLGPFPLFGASENDPLGFCEAMPVFELDQRMHRAIYGFQDDAIDYRLAGEIVHNRNMLLPEVRQLPEEWVREGIHIVQTLVQSSEISGFKHPATALFWDYWHHVLSHFPEVAVHLIFTIRSPYAIASSHVRRAQRPQRVEDVLNLLAAYYSRLIHIHRTWNGPKTVVHFSAEHYPTSLRAAVESCGLSWDENLFREHFDVSRIHHNDQKVNHPVEEMYETLLRMTG